MHGFLGTMLLLGAAYFLGWKEGREAMKKEQDEQR